jgi:hypothetical protein
LVIGEFETGCTSSRQPKAMLVGILVSPKHQLTSANTSVPPATPVMIR